MACGQRSWGMLMGGYSADMRPIDPVTFDEAARILGVARSTVQRMVLDCRLTSYGQANTHHRLSQGEVESLATRIYQWWEHVHDADSYWVTGAQAASVLGVSRQRVQQLAAADRLPFVGHETGTRLFRRSQLEVLARW